MLIDKTTLKFIVVGIINTLFGSLLMFVAYNVLHCGYWVSSALNYVAGSILSYFLNKYFTFKNTEQNISQKIKFIANIVLCYILAYGIAKPATLYFLSKQSNLLQDNIAMLVGIFIFTGCNYIGQRYFVFRKQKDK